PHGLAARQQAAVAVGAIVQDAVSLADEQDGSGHDLSRDFFLDYAVEDRRTTPFPALKAAGQEQRQEQTRHRTVHGVESSKQPPGVSRTSLLAERSRASMHRTSTIWSEYGANLHAQNLRRRD